MKKLLILIFLTSCTTQNSIIDKNKVSFDISEDLSFEDFKTLLTKYAETKAYPDIDK